MVGGKAEEVEEEGKTDWIKIFNNWSIIRAKYLNICKRSKARMMWILQDLKVRESSI